MANLKKLFVWVPAGKTTDKTNPLNLADLSATAGNKEKVYFDAGTGAIYVNGKKFGVEFQSEQDLTNLKAELAGIGGTGEPATVAAAISTAKSEVLGTATVSGKTQTVGAVSDRVAALETLVGDDAADADSVINKLQEVYNWFAGVAETETGKALIESVAANKAAIEALDVTDAAVDGKYVSSVSQEDGKITVTRADLPTLSVKTGSDNYVGVNGHEVEIKTTALGDAVGLTKATTGDNAGKWVAADGSVAANPGLVTAADVAAEIVADEQVIAAALNDHETRISANETKLTGLAESTVQASISAAVTAASHAKTTITDGSSAGKLKVDGTDITITAFDAAGTAQTKIEALDKAETTASVDGAHVTVKYSETDGIVSMSVTESDIASAATYKTDVTDKLLGAATVSGSVAEAKKAGDDAATAVSTLSGGAASTVKAAEDRIKAIEDHTWWETYA